MICFQGNNRALDSNSNLSDPGFDFQPNKSEKVGSCQPVAVGFMY